MGSVKDLKVLIGVKEDKLGKGIFNFSDRYSVFDWGEMPDSIPRKGEALCMMGAYFFERAASIGIKTHYRGLVEYENTALLSDLIKPTNIMEVDLVRVIRPKFEEGKYDYSSYFGNLKNFLIPLEIIYRNGLPEGSSVFKRLRTGETSLEKLGLSHYPQPGEKLEDPVFDLSTKLEEKDRYLGWDEAKEISRITDEEVLVIKETLSKVNSLITENAKRIGLVNEDGKIELAYDDNRSLMLVDVIGTLDECRFTYQELHVSKEVARQFYKKTRGYQDVADAKKLAEEKKTEDWKSLCRSKPQKLPPRLKQIISQMYMSTANAFIGRQFFPSPRLEEVVENYRKWLEKNDF